MMHPYLALVIQLMLGWLTPSANQNHGAPSSPPQGGGSPSGLAVTAAALSIASWFIIPLVGAVGGMVCAKMELSKIESGESPEAGRVFAQIGWWAGLANLVLSVVGGCISALFVFGVFGLLFGGAAVSSGVQ